MNDENPRHLLFNDIFNNERITGNTSATNNINFYDLINNHEVFISNTINELKNDLDKYNYVYNKDDIHKELPKRSSKPNIMHHLYLAIVRNPKYPSSNLLWTRILLLGLMG